MRLLFSEFNADYSSYSFGYAVYAVREPDDHLPDLYARGFLPYTGRTDVEPAVFYLARSVRVDLAAFENTSENRRINRKVENLQMNFRVLPKAEFDVEFAGFRRLCLDAARARFSDNAMTDERLSYVLSRETASHIFEYKAGERIVGYVVAYLDEEILHYWFAFYDVALMHAHGLGKWMMWAAIDYAKRQGLQYVYLGTAYHEKALYKVRDFKGIQFFDGTGWHTDLKRLKHYCKTDGDAKPADRIKLEGRFDCFDL